MAVRLCSRSNEHRVTVLSARGLAALGSGSEDRVVCIGTTNSLEVHTVCTQGTQNTPLKESA